MNTAPTREYTPDEFQETTARFAELGSTDPQRIAREYLSVDWEQISRDNGFRDIGTELFENAEFLESIGGDGAVAVVASIMENWWSSVPRRINRDVAQTIATGFAFAMVRKATEGVLGDDEEEK